MGLRIYTVHLPTSSLREVVRDAVPHLVKEGFSWPAFFLGVIWALWHRLWIEAAALIALFLAAGVILDSLEPGESIQLAVMIAIAVLIGASGNNWRRESLRRRGFVDAGVVAGPDTENALCRYLDLRALAAPDSSALGTARFGMPASAALAAAPQTANQFASMVLGQSASSDRREFSVEPRFETRDARDRRADQDSARPSEPPDTTSPGRASPGTGYGG